MKRKPTSLTKEDTCFLNIKFKNRFTKETKIQFRNCQSVETWHLSVVDQLSKMTGLLLMGPGLQGDGLWMVLPWPDHTCLHLFLGILKQHCTPCPMPQKPS